MNETPTHGHSAAVQEEEQLKYGKIVAVAVASLCAFAAVIFWSTNILNSTAAELQKKGALPLPALAGQYEVGIVNQKPFALDQRAALKRNQALARLNSYGWVDKQAGTVHIPIAVAMQMEVERAANKPQPAPTPAPQTPPANEPQKPAQKPAPHKAGAPKAAPQPPAQPTK